MKTKIKIMFCALMAVAALMCSVATLADIGVLDANAAAGVRYLLRSRDGYVCVYRLPDNEEPILVSGVQTARLSASDRAALALGVAADDYAEALEKLDSLGS